MLKILSKKIRIKHNNVVVITVALLTLHACSKPDKEKDTDSDSYPPVTMASPTTTQGSTEPSSTDKDNGLDFEKPISPDVAGQGIAITDLPIDESALANTEEIIRRLGLASYHRAGFHGQRLKIAVLDNGFAGLSRSIGKRLPPNTRLFESPRSDMQVTSHGVKLAEIVYAVTTGFSSYQSHIPSPEILLFNSNGYTNFVGAVDRIIQEKVDIVLYAQVWEYGGNHDGGGFINRQVRRAIDAGIMWVNAAGNLGQGTWSGPVEIDQNLNVALPYPARGGSYVRFTVPQDNTPVKIVLAWNDFDDSKDYKTPQDLDLIVEDAMGTEIATARLIQDGHTDPATDARYSAHAREIVQLMMRPATYYLRVVAKSKNFDAHSRLRLTVDGVGVRVLDQTTEDTVLIPADNPDVLTIGASDVLYSGRKMSMGLLVKPEINVISNVVFADGTSYQGTSAATALAVGAIAVFRSAYGKVDRDDVVSLAAFGVLGSPGEWGVPILKLRDFGSL
jgi:hypothetical protein